MLFLHHIRRIPSKIPSQHTPLPSFFPSFFLSSSSQITPTKPAPRKGKQATRRLLKLLSSSSSSSQNTQNPNFFQALNALETSPQTLSSAQASSLISAASNPLLSFDFYRFLKSSKPLFQPDSSLFTSLLRTQLHSLSPLPFRIQFYLVEMKKHGISLSPTEFRSVLAPLVPEKSDLARSFLDQLIEVLSPDSGIYAIAISVFADHGLVDEAVKVSERARVEIGNLGLEFYSSLIGIYKVTSNAKAAMEVFLEMEERGVSADEGACKVLLGILCRVGWAKLSWVVLEGMMRRVGFRPNEGLGLDLMRAFLKEGMVSEAGFLLKEGILKGKESFLVFTETMAEKGMHLEAFEILKTMGEPGVSSLIYGYGKMGLIEEAEKIFRKIKSSDGVKIGESVYSSMIYVYSRAEFKRSAEIVWEEMEISGGFSGEACLFMMSMYGEIGLLENVVKMFDRWKESGVSINVESYAVLMLALIKAGKLNQARDHLSDMRRFGIAPTNSIYSLMMEGYLRAGLLNPAVALLEEYKMSGLRVEDEVIANCVVEVLIKLGRYYELRHYLDGFVRCGMKLSREKGAVLMEMCKDDICLRKITQLMQWKCF